jgi:hypothetical protein
VDFTPGLLNEVVLWKLNRYVWQLHFSMFAFCSPLRYNRNEGVLTVLFNVGPCEDKDFLGCFSAAAIDTEGEGAIYAVLFVGPDPEQRAQEYADWKNEQAAAVRLNAG